MKNYLFKTSKSLRTTRILSLLIVLFSSLLISFYANAQQYFYVGPTSLGTSSTYSVDPTIEPEHNGDTSAGLRSFAGHNAEYSTAFCLYPASWLDPGIDLITSVAFWHYGWFTYEGGLAHCQPQDELLF